MMFSKIYLFHRLTAKPWCSVDLYYFQLDSQRCQLKIMSCKSNEKET